MLFFPHNTLRNPVNLLPDILLNRPCTDAPVSGCEIHAKGLRGKYLVRVIDLVVLEHMEFDLLLGVLDLLWLGVGLLLALLTTSTETENEVQSGLLLDVVVLEGAAILKLLTSEDETLLVWRDTLLVLDLGLDSLDGVGALDLLQKGAAQLRIQRSRESCSSLVELWPSTVCQDQLLPRG